MNHSFDINIAAKYGVPVAIVLNNFAYWINHNRANNTNFYDGRYWTYNSIDAFQILFPYWSFKQMRTILEKVKETDLILTDNFNKLPQDKTTWFSFTDKGLKLFNMFEEVHINASICPNGQISNGEACEVENSLKPAPQTICPNGQMQMPKRANANAQMGTPLPNINTNINADVNKRESAHSVDNFKTEEALQLCRQKNLDYETEFKKFSNYYQGKEVFLGKWLSWLGKAKVEIRPTAKNDSLEDYIRRYAKDMKCTYEEAREHYRQRGFA